MITTRAWLGSVLLVKVGRLWLSSVQVTAAAAGPDRETQQPVHKSGGQQRRERRRQVAIRRRGCIAERVEQRDVDAAAGKQRDHCGRIEAAPEFIRRSRRLGIDGTNIQLSAPQAKIIDDLDSA